MPCANCGAQQELIAEELVKVHMQIEELRRFDIFIFAIVFVHYLVDYGLKLLYPETWVKIQDYLRCKRIRKSIREEELQEEFIK
jgi:hypothetical protein